MLSSAASSVGLPSIVYSRPPAPGQPRAPKIVQPRVPAGIDPQLFARAKAAFDRHRQQIAHHDFIGIADFARHSSDPRFHVVHLPSGYVESYRVAHGSGSDPSHCGYLQRFSNVPGSEATSEGTYVTGQQYHGKYGLSMRTRGLDWTNNNALSRAIVIHNAWYAEPEMVAQHGKLGRSQGCFAFSRHDQYRVMHRLSPGHMIYADKLA